jgi:hypothetical protein
MAAPSISQSVVLIVVPQNPPFKSLKTKTMSSMSALTSLVPVFDGQNWTLWSERMESFFLAQKLWWVVMTPREACTGGEEASSSIASAPSQAAPQAPTPGGKVPATACSEDSAPRHKQTRR